MSARLNLTLFAHLCGHNEAELDLAEAALLIAEAEYPGLDLARYTAALDDLGRGARAAVETATSPEGRVERAVRFLYEDAGFHGNDDDYYDPRNSFLNDVLDRRTGIPISLGLVLTEVCTRAGVDAQGVSFPGHFLVRSDTPRGIIVIDPFTGRPLDTDELRALYTRAGGDEHASPARALEPATKAQVLVRMLNNLRAIYEKEGDDERLRGVLERIQVLAPGDALRRQIERLGGTEPWRGGRGAVN
jgi:regulator of sirC expression with transglutaminase-like and TPR domain